VSQALENRARRGVTGAVAALGTVAMLLAAMGLFGVTAFAVVQRTQELGIRIALGARRGDLLATVLGQYVPAVAAGSAAGCLLAVAVGQVLRSRTVGIAVADPIAYLAALAVLFSVALLAVLVAALGASRVDPVVALRHD
jgi:ABC-type antimicrobial peptide transport system permease subunit